MFVFDLIFLPLIIPGSGYDNNVTVTFLLFHHKHLLSIIRYDSLEKKKNILGCVSSQLSSLQHTHTSPAHTTHTHTPSISETLDRVTHVYLKQCIHKQTAPSLWLASSCLLSWSSFPKAWKQEETEQTSALLFDYLNFNKLKGDFLSFSFLFFCPVDAKMLRLEKTHLMLCNAPGNYAKKTVRETKRRERQM